MKRAVLIVAELTDTFDPTAELFGYSPVERLVKSAQNGGADRVVIAGNDETMKPVRKHCVRLGAEFISPSDTEPNHVANALDYLQTRTERIVVISINYPFANASTFRTLFECEAELATAVSNGVRSCVLAFNASHIAELTENHADFAPLLTRAIEVECGDEGIVTDASLPNSDLEAVCNRSELHSKFRPVTKFMLGFEESCYGPGTQHLLRLLSEMGIAKKVIKLLGMGHMMLLEIKRKMDSKLGFTTFHHAESGVYAGATFVTEEAKEFVDTYEKYVRDCEAAVQAVFEQYYGDGRYDR